MMICPRELRVESRGAAEDAENAENNNRGKTMRELDDITDAIISAAIKIHREGLQRVVNDLPPSASPRLRVNQEP